MKNEIKTRKAVTLCGGAEAQINLLNGENIVTIPTIADNEMGIEISHILHQNGTGENNFCCGNNLRLNLHERFVKNENANIDADYIYTDCMGDTYKFKEYFYYVGDDKLKRRITRDNVSVLEDGTLTYNDGTNTYVVEREITTYDGMKASAKLEGVKNLQNYEQRSEELKQAEEQSQSYKDVLFDFVITDENGNILKEIGKDNITLKDIVDAAPNAIRVLSKSEAVNLKYLAETKGTLNQQVSDSYLRSLTKINTRNIDNMIQNLKPKSDKATHTLNYLFVEESIYSYKILNKVTNAVSEIGVINSFDDNFALKSEHVTTENNRIFDKYITGNDFVLHRNELANYFSSVDQLENVTAQIEMLAERSVKNKEKIEEYYSEYLDLEEKAKQLRFQTPVSFVMSEKGARGFNENGDLVVMYSKNGDYIAFEYERYFVGSDVKYRIAKIYDSKERVITLAYSDKRNLLYEITNSKGEAVTIEYIGTKIKKIIYPNNSFLSFYFASGLFRITDKNDLRNEMLLTDNKLCTITKSTMVTSVTHGNVVKGASAYEKCFENTFTYNESECKTIFTDDNGLKFIYVFDPTTERLSKYFEEKNGTVIKAEKYIFTDLASKIYETYKAKRNSLYTGPHTSYTFSDSDYSKRIVNIFNLLQSDVQIVNEENLKKTTSTDYFYNADDKVVRKETSFTMNRISDEVLLDEKKSVELFEYNSFGSIAIKQSYVEGEEATNGIDIEEHIYDKNGNEIRAIKYNSLDPSSKLYTEREFDENGRVSAELDATGKYKTSYEYENGTSTVSAENLPNGSCLAYGYSDMDGSSAISISTKDGEENSIQVLRTNDLPTKVKSNDVEFGYAYDYKGRTTRIDMNGLVVATMEYDEGTDLKMSSVNEKGEETMTVTDYHGNVQNIVRIIGDDGKTIFNTYNEKDLITKVAEYANGITNTKVYEYSDDFSKIKSCTLSNNNNVEISKETFTYDNYGSVSQRNLSTVNGNTTYNYTYSDDSKRKLTQVQMVEDNIVIKPATDNLSRNVGKSITVSNNQIINDRISYLKNGNHATNIPVAIEYADKNRISYKYDRMGNIVKVFDNGILSADYEYDKLGRLTRENNKRLNETTLFRYDNRGNILSKTVYAYTHKVGDELEELEHNTFDYGYSALDCLCKYGEQTVTNNIVSGQPYSWKGNDIVWNGKEMVGYGTNTFTYDVAFRRTSKNNITFDYDVNGNLVRQSNGISFVYDHNSLIGFKYQSTMYFYRRDILGNIIAILDTNGDIVVKYTYDAWGNHTSTGNQDLAAINPYRYRGYYYDTETGLYFLKTRYYDPMVGRFISMDDVDYIDPETIGGLNLFAYCNNNPVMNFDPTGHSTILTGLIVGAIMGGVTANNRDKSVFNGIVLGAGIGSLFGMGLDVAFTFLGCGNVGLGAAIGFGTISNLVNTIYYTYCAEPVELDESRVVNGSTASYYVTDDGGFRRISRWDRLNHVKAMTGESLYSFNAWRYYSEYNAHMWGWLGSLKFDFLSEYKGSLISAYVDPYTLDTRPEILLSTILMGILGI